MHTTLQQLLGVSGSEPVDVTDRSKPRSAITHDAIDELHFDQLAEQSPTFRARTIEEPPVVPPTMDKPTPVDPSTATPEEVADFQQQQREYRQAVAEAEANGDTYEGWTDLQRDLYYGLVTHDEPLVLPDGEVDPASDLNKKVLEQLVFTEEFNTSRKYTRKNPLGAGCAVIAATPATTEVFQSECVRHMREREELEKRRKELEETEVLIDQIVPPQGEQPTQEPGEQPTGGAATAGGEGKPEGGPKVKLTPEAEKQLKELQSRQGELKGEAEKLAQPKPLSREAEEKLKKAAERAQEGAEAAGALPQFGGGGQGLGKSEPTYTSPEQALQIAEEWAKNPELRQMAELFGRLDKDIRFKRARRVVGGNDEIVDVRTGDNLEKLLPSELGYLASPETEDDFLMRYTQRELLEYQTVGEEHAGRGPVVMVLDGSGSMGGVRNVWSRAVAMCLLHISRLEKRDFHLIEFSREIAEWSFKASEPMQAQAVLDMASHFFGGGTLPILGVKRAAEVMKTVPAFEKADVVLVGDGEAGFTDEDKNLRDDLKKLGVRIFGICVGGSWNYIKNYCEPDGYTVDVHDFNLTDPSDATQQLAERIT